MTADLALNCSQAVGRGHMWLLIYMLRKLTLKKAWVMQWAETQQWGVFLSENPEITNKKKNSIDECQTWVESKEVSGSLAMEGTRLCQRGGWDCERHNVGNVAVAEVNWISLVPTPGHMQGRDIKCPYPWQKNKTEYRESTRLKKPYWWSPVTSRALSQFQLNWGGAGLQGWAAWIYAIKSGCREY